MGTEWREDGEDWEAFLGHGDDLYVFPTPAHLAAFIRTSAPSTTCSTTRSGRPPPTCWSTSCRPTTTTASTSSACPTWSPRPADIWTLAALTDTSASSGRWPRSAGWTASRRCSTRPTGSRLPPLGQQAFIGRNGEKLWNEIGAVVAERWDEVIDALDAHRHHPGRRRRRAGQPGRGGRHQRGREDVRTTGRSRRSRRGARRGPGVLGRDRRRLPGDHGRRPHRLHPALLPGRRSGLPRREPSDPDLLLRRGSGELPDGGRHPHRLSTLEVWPEIRRRSPTATRRCSPAPRTPTARRSGQGLLEGPAAVDGKQLELAVELLIDAALERGDTETVEARRVVHPAGQPGRRDHPARPRPAAAVPAVRRRGRGLVRAGRPVRRHPGLGRPRGAEAGRQAGGFRPRGARATDRLSARRTRRSDPPGRSGRALIPLGPVRGRSNPAPETVIRTRVPGRIGVVTMVRQVTVIGSADVSSSTAVMTQSCPKYSTAPTRAGTPTGFSPAPSDLTVSCSGRSISRPRPPVVRGPPGRTRIGTLPSGLTATAPSAVPMNSAGTRHASR